MSTSKSGDQVSASAFGGSLSYNNYAPKQERVTHKVLNNVQGAIPACSERNVAQKDGNINYVGAPYMVNMIAYSLALVVPPTAKNSFVGEGSGIARMLKLPEHRACGKFCMKCSSIYRVMVVT